MQSIASQQFHKTKTKMKSIPHSGSTLKNNLLVHASKQIVMTQYK